jgi:hypothetical protein
MRVGLFRMDMVRRPNVHRVLSLALCSLALVGWGVNGGANWAHAAE